MKRVSVFIVALLALTAAVPAHATFHLMQIEQVIGGVDGDVTMQAIQLRMRSAFQNLVANGRIRVWDSAGGNPIIVNNLLTNVVNHGAGVHILIASANFLTRTTPNATADFVIPMANLIPASYLAAGSLTFENNLGNQIYWRLSWGGAGYAGPTNGVAGLLGNDADGNFGVFPGILPSAGTSALRFTGPPTAASTTNQADYAVSAPNSVWGNNAGLSFTLDTVATGIGALPFAVLSQNFPNPFNPTTQIFFNMREAGRATLQIYDGQGRLVTTLLDGNVPEGENRAIWNGRDASGQAMATGVYFYRLVTGDVVQTRKMMLLK